MLHAIGAAITGMALVGCTSAAPLPPEPDDAAALSTVVQPAGYSPDRVLNLQVPSAALGQSVGVQVILPAPASQAPKDGWPVVYFLHGSSGQADGNRFTWQRKFSYLYDYAADSGVMVVMPEGGKAGYYSNWNSGPKWATFHLTELRAYLKANLPANTNREAIAGYSMGGFGALSYAALNPGRFRAVVALSPVADPLRNPSVVTDDLRDAYGKSAKYQLWGNPSTASGKKTWKAHDPYYLASGLRGAYVYLYAGKNGGSFESTLRAQTIKLSNRLKSLGTAKLKITLRTHTSTQGTHSYPSWSTQLKAAWVGMVNAIKK